LEPRPWRIARLTVSIVLAIATISVPIVIYLLQIQKKQLSYSLLASSQIGGSALPVLLEVQVQTGGRIAKEITASTIEIENTGNVPIKKEDFEKEIKVDFGAESEVLRAIISEAEPKYLLPKLEWCGGQVLISALLLNPGDHFKLQAITSKQKTIPTVECRIVGVTEIKAIPVSSPSPPVSVGWLFACFYILTFGMGAIIQLVISIMMRADNTTRKGILLGLALIYLAMAAAWIVTAVNAQDRTLFSSVVITMLFYACSLVLGSWLGRLMAIRYLFSWLAL